MMTKLENSEQAPRDNVEMNVVYKFCVITIAMCVLFLLDPVKMERTLAWSIYGMSRKQDIRLSFLSN